MCSRSVFCLAWGVPTLETVSFYLGLGLCAKISASGRGPTGQCFPVLFPVLFSSSVCVPRVGPVRPVSPEDTPKISSGFDPGYYPVTAFALGPDALEILCALFKSEVSISPNPVEFLRSGSTGFQGQMFWALFLLVPDPHAGGAWCGAQHSHSCRRMSVI